MLATNNLFSGPDLGDPSSPCAINLNSIGQSTNPSLLHSSEAMQEQGTTLEQFCDRITHLSSADPLPVLSSSALNPNAFAASGLALVDDFNGSHATHGDECLSAEPASNLTERSALKDEQNFYAVRSHSHDRIVSSADSPSFHPSRDDLERLADNKHYQDGSRTNFFASGSLSSCDSALKPLELGHDFESSACENDLCSSPPTSSPPMLFSSSPPPSSQSSAIDPFEDSASTKEVYETLFMSEHPSSLRSQDDGFQEELQNNNSEEARNINIYAISESSPPTVTSSHCATSAPYSLLESGSLLFDHLNLLPDEQYHSQELVVDAECEPIPRSDDITGPMHRECATALPPWGTQTLVQKSALTTSFSSDSSLTAGEAASTDIPSSISTPQPTLLLSSLPPSSPPEQLSSSPFEDIGSPAVQNTESVALRAPQEKTTGSYPSLSSSQIDYAMAEIFASDESSVGCSEKASATYPQLQQADLPVYDLSSRSLLGKRKAEDQGVDMPSYSPVKNDEHPALTQNVVSEGRTHSGTSPLIDTVFPTKSTLPNPRRSTIAAQKLQHKKLTTPFRSPVLKRPKLELVPIIESPPQAQQSLALAINETVEQAIPLVTLSAPDMTDTKKRHRTQRAAAQFKSPLWMDTSKLVSSVRMTPTIQALERKVQLLKRAVKVKQDGEDETLQALVGKWTEAGREIAWEIWELVKDNASSDEQGRDRSRSKGKLENTAFEDSWGWNEKTARENERNWGWNVAPQGTADAIMDEINMDRNSDDTETCKYEEDDANEKKQDTLGTMLIQLGIAPETLGWNEEEGVFQGE